MAEGNLPKVVNKIIDFIKSKNFAEELKSPE